MNWVRRSHGKKQEGQTVVEYLLVMSVVITGVLLVLGKLKRDQWFFKNISEPLVKHITYNYKYGDPGAQGWDEGQPNKHIQISKPGDGKTFRLFQPKRP